MFRRLTAGRVSVLVMGIIAVVALVLLSAGLPNLKFEEPRSLAMRNSPALPSPGAPQGETSRIPLRTLIIVGAVVAATAIVLMITDKKARKLILKLLLYTGVFMLAGILAPRLNQGNQPTATPPPGGAALANAPAQVTPYVAPEIPWQMAFLVTLLLALVVLGLVYYSWRRRSSSASHSSSLAEIGQIAQSALDDLDSGRDWSDAIIQCYRRMNEAVGDRRGLHRNEGMTAAEFAGYLQGAGLPASSVQRLTRLFEAARYGDRKATREEVDDAANCLRTIVAACGEAA